MTSIAAVEEQVRAELEPHLAPYAECADRAFTLIEDVTDLASGILPQTAPANIQLLVLGRLQGDLRACWLSASVGYALPAMTLASSIQEIAFGAAYLESSDDRAREWVEHENEKKQYPECGHRRTIESVAPLLSLTPEQVDQEYQIYRQLCCAKHGNPVLQRTYGIDSVQGRARVQPQPRYSEETKRLCQYALANGTRPLLFLLQVFARLHVPATHEPQLQAAVSDVHKMILQQCFDDGIVYQDKSASS